MNVTEEFLHKIRQLDGFNNAIITNIDVFTRKKVVCFYLVTDLAYSESVLPEAEEIAEAYMPAGFAAVVHAEKRTPDEALLRQEIMRFMKSRFPAASAFLEEKDIEVEKRESGALFCFVLAAGEQALFTADNILDEVAKHLQSTFCGTYFGNVKIAEKQREALEEEIIEDAAAPKIRVFPVMNFKKLDGSEPEPKYATYIADCNSQAENVCICGRILNINRRESKKGKEYYSITLTDDTGNVRGVYFPKKSTAEKIAQLAPGASIVCTGDFELFNGNISYSIKKIDYGAQPEGFVPEKLPGRKVPKGYHHVFPEPYEDYTQSGFFDDLELPADLKAQTFVVFDIETTGLNSSPASGKVDRIIEIGAVKMQGGNMTEKFSSFIACPEKLPPNIVELTGIHDEDLVGAPDIEEVLADFYKFTDGCALVGHNVMFDYRFVKYYGEEYRYFFDAKTYDTMTIGQEVLRGEVSNFKLNTLADYYDIHFNHHRAFDDALTTAKIFQKLVKKRGGLQGL